MKAIRFTVLSVLMMVILAACGGQTATPPVQDVPTTVPTFTPTPLPQPKEITVCLGQEPKSLYPLGYQSPAARSILSAVYDGPIDHVNYEYLPVILEKLPAISDGDASIIAVRVSIGDEVVNADGLPATLDKGVRVFPSGCRSNDCAIEYDGVGDLLMDQMSAAFQLLPGLRWADGQPVTAHDSVFTYTLESYTDIAGNEFLIDRTQSYEALDDLNVEWRGKPGYIDTTYFINFWSPLPEHAWGEFEPADLPQIDIAAIYPMGWGPFAIDEWIPGESIRLVRNPLYHGAAQGLPHLDALNFRFYPDANQAISALLNGQCDLLDPSISLEGQIALLLEMQSNQQAALMTATTPVMEWLSIGIKPASYDVGFAPYNARPDILSDVRTRQAIAMCLDRQQVVDTVLYGLSVVPDSYLPAEHPQYNDAVTRFEYNVEQASSLLENIGWMDHDNDPATPRISLAVSGIAGGRPLVLDYYTTLAIQRQQASAILADSLQRCGIGTNPVYLPADKLYAPGPEGILFGRQFDLAQYAMGNMDVGPSCAWFMSAAVPNANNFWIGTNVSGFTSSAFDQACQLVQTSMPDEASYRQAYHDTQALFAQELPVIPLYQRIKIAVTGTKVCGFELDATAETLYNVEQVDLCER